jgi:histidine triad (HIT) family protein
MFDQHIEGVDFIICNTDAKAIEQSFPCNRVGMVTIGLEVPHAHLHLIPINEAKDMEFSQPKLKLSKEEFEAIQKSIQSHLPA